MKLGLLKTTFMMMSLSSVLLMSCTETHTHDDQSHHHAHEGKAEFLAHSAIMVESGSTKILFDPIFDNDYGRFQLVAQDTQALLMTGQAPFDGVDAVFVSHAHSDHFSAGMMIEYLTANPDVKLIAPEQALTHMQKDEHWDEAIMPRIFAEFTEMNTSSNEAVILDGASVAYTRLRLPHAGGARQAKVENIVYRVSLSPEATVMHLGDTDLDETGFRAQSPVFKERGSDMAFVPYWFFGAVNGSSGEALLNAKHVVGVHVPKDVPDDLASSGADYFSVAGETRDLKRQEKTDD